MIAIFLFYNISNGPQSRLSFSKDYKHCNVITYDGKHWLLFEFDALGLHAKILKVKSFDALARGLPLIPSLTSMIAVEIKSQRKYKWRPFLVRSCNEFNRYITNVDIGFTLNPRHLHGKLIKYNAKRNFDILRQWRRDMGFFGDEGSDQSEADRLLTEQIDTDKAELEQKRQSLVAERLNIIKSTGMQNWNSPKSPQASMPKSSGWLGMGKQQ